MLAPRRANLGAMLAPRESSGGHVGSKLEAWGHNGANLVSCWLILAQCWSILASCWPSWPYVRRSWLYVGLSAFYVGLSWSIDDPKRFQHGQLGFDFEEQSNCRPFNHHHATKRPLNWHGRQTNSSISDITFTPEIC